MTIPDTSTPVVVLSSGHHCGLGITRSLGRLGATVFNVDSTPVPPAFFSKYCRGRFVWDFNKTSAAASVERLIAISRKAGRRCLLIPTTDRDAIFVEDNGNDLRTQFTFSAPDPPLVRTLCSKREVHQLAGALGIPTAKTYCPSSPAEFAELAAELVYPVIVKSASPLFGPGGKNKVIAGSRQEFFSISGKIETTQPDLVVQEFIPGGLDWMFNGYFNQRTECLAGFTGRKLRRCPANTGVTSLGQCQYNPAVAVTAVAFMQAVRYRGIVDMDFRLDPRDGLYKLLDVNPRIGGTFRLFTSDQGLDMARALYLDLTGQAFSPSQPTDGRGWIVEDFDLLAAWSCFRQRTLGFREWARSVFGVNEGAFVALDDPLPFLGMLCADAVELLRRGSQHQARRRTAPG